MTPTRQGSIRLFRFWGIDVFLHWSWFLVAAYALSSRTVLYSSFIWNVLEYLGLFSIVLLHEFGHSLACRQVGGQANQIVLWPLGGVAYVSPPPRPGATLWSIAAGPLVNVMLLPLLTLLGMLSRSSGWAQAMPNAHLLLQTIWMLNLVLLIFNLLPIYPLDGGQILRSLLWFLFGRAHSLMAASIVGFAGISLLLLLALWQRSVWLGILCVFLLLHCWNGLVHARRLARAAKRPRRPGLTCPACRTAPPLGAYWMCGLCRRMFDTFETQAVCPHCGAQYGLTICPECGGSSPISSWMDPASGPRV